MKKEGIETMVLAPLNKKVGSFPARVMTRLMLYGLNTWVEKYMNDKQLKLSMIKVVCDSHAYVGPGHRRQERLLKRCCTWTKTSPSELTT